MKKSEKSYSKIIYSRDVLEQAAIAYKNIADIEIKEKGGDFVCLFNRCKAESQLVVNEFNNYLIELLNS